MEFSYSPRLEAIKAQASNLALQIMQYEDRCEAGGGLSRADREQIARLLRPSGFLAMNMPVEWGGGGLGWLEQVVAEEEFGRLTNGLYLTVARPAVALFAASDDQRQRYLLPEIRGDRFGGRAITEPGAGSDPKLIRTVAVRTGDRYRISGEKWFVTMGDVADYLIVLAIVLPDEAPTLFLVDKDQSGVWQARSPKHMHTFAFGHPDFILEDVEVGPDAVLGDVGGGWELVQNTVLEERVVVSAHVVGAAERALSLAVDWARERIQGGGPIIGHQLVKSMIADSVLDLTLARTYVHRVGWELDHDQDRKRSHARVALAKVAATEAAGRVIDRAVQIFGGRGYRRDNPVERLYREVRVDRIWMGTSEMQRLAVANEVEKRGFHRLAGFSAQPSDDSLAVPTI